ncbi:MAG: YdcF family protein [Bacteroidota bacterium]
MFFLLSKVLHFLTAPLTWILLLVVMGIVSKRPDRKRRRLRNALVLALLFTNPFLADEAFRWWEAEPKTYDELATYDIGMVLGGFSYYDAKLDRVYFNLSGDRLFQTLELYRQGTIRKIMIVGGSGKLTKQPLSEAEMVKRYLLRLRVPEADIITETASKNTWENAVNAEAIIADRYPNASLLLITSAFHMPRARRCFEKAGLEVTTYPVSKFSGPRKYHFDHLFIPHAEALYGWSILVHEWLGYAVYGITGKM